MCKLTTKIQSNYIFIFFNFMIFHVTMIAWLCFLKHILYSPVLNSRDRGTVPHPNFLKPESFKYIMLFLYFYQFFLPEPWIRTEDFLKGNNRVNNIYWPRGFVFRWNYMIKYKASMFAFRNICIYYCKKTWSHITNRRGGLVVERSPRMRDIGVRRPN